MCVPADVRTFPNPQLVAQAVAQELTFLFQKLGKTQDLVTVAFSGGSTPKLLFKELLTHSTSLPWEKTHVFLVDERWVPVEHEERNFRVLKELLLDHVPIPSRNVHPMPVAQPDPAVASADYELTLGQVFGIQQPDIPAFDLVLLGLGSDGHTASMFPGEPSQVPLTTDRWVVAPYVPKLASYRMTLTLRVLNNARNVWFLVTGPSKEEILPVVLGKEPFDISLYPSQAVDPPNPPVWWVDEEAATKLNKTN